MRTVVMTRFCEEAAWFEEWHAWYHDGLKVDEIIVGVSAWEDLSRYRRQNRPHLSFLVHGQKETHVHHNDDFLRLVNDYIQSHQEEQEQTWLLVVDSDEFLSLDGKTLPEFLFQQSPDPLIGAHSFEWLTIQNLRTTRQPFTVLLQSPDPYRTPWNYNPHRKTIARLDAIHSWNNVHRPTLRPRFKFQEHSPRNPRLPRLCVFHLFTRSLWNHLFKLVCHKLPEKGDEEQRRVMRQIFETRDWTRLGEIRRCFLVRKQVHHFPKCPFFRVRLPPTIKNKEEIYCCERDEETEKAMVLEHLPHIKEMLQEKAWERFITNDSFFS